MDQFFERLNESGHSFLFATGHALTPVYQQNLSSIVTALMGRILEIKPGWTGYLIQRREVDHTRNVYKSKVYGKR